MNNFTKILKKCNAYEQLCIKVAVALIPVDLPPMRPANVIMPESPIHPVTLEPGRFVAAPSSPYRAGLGLPDYPTSMGPGTVAPSPTTAPSVSTPAAAIPAAATPFTLRGLLESVKTKGVSGISDLYKKYLTPGNEFNLPEKANIWRDPQTGEIKVRDGVIDPSTGLATGGFTSDSLGAELAAREQIAAQEQQAAAAAKQNLAKNMASIEAKARAIAAAKSPLGVLKSTSIKSTMVLGALSLLYKTLFGKEPSTEDKSKKEIIDIVRSQGSGQLSVSDVSRHSNDFNAGLSDLKNSVSNERSKATLEKFIAKNNETMSELESLDSPLSLDDPSNLSSFAGKISSLEIKLSHQINDLSRLQKVLIKRGDKELADKCQLMINNLSGYVGAIQGAREAMSGGV